MAELMMRIATPLGTDTFDVLSFSGTEAISKLFSFEIELVSKKSQITFEQMAGQNVTVGIRTGKTERFFNGMIIAFTMAQIAIEPDGPNIYHAVMVPTLWAHTEIYDCRIFQEKTVLQILEQVLDGFSLGNGKRPTIEYTLSDVAGSFVKREYCVQYNESNFDFISRICEEEGIFFFFKHDDGHHKLVFANKPDKHEPYPSSSGGKVKYQQNTSGFDKEEIVNLMQVNKKLTAGKYTARDFNFTMSANELLVTKDTQKGKDTSKGEIYEYPGGYEVTANQGNTLADIRIQARDAKIFSIHGQSNCRGFTPGFKFLLDGYPIDTGAGNEYVLTKVRHVARQDVSSNSGGGDSYVNTFNCIPLTVPFRPSRQTRKPKIVSSQTAIVTGPDGEEIHTNPYGQVKVRFHWDRRGVNDRGGNLSCWIRVSQSWAGGKWGAMHIPRIGQEVIVNFLDGDPDRPIITGRVYNDQKMPPYDLPADKTKSTIKSNTSKDGGNSNEIRFEDLKDKEEFYTHAAKDQNEVVENDISTEVRANQVIRVEKNRAVTVTSGNETITIQSGTRSVSVKSNEDHTNSANFIHDVSGNYTLKVSGNISIEAGGTVKISGSKIILNG